MTAKHRKSWAPLLTALSVMLLTVLSPGQTRTPAQEYKGLLGTWEVQAEGVSYSIIFEFLLEDGVLKGKYTGSSGTTQMDNLTFEKNLVRFSVTVSTMTLDYSAVIDGDKLSGEVTLQYGQAGITGKKVRSGGA